jgi:hypothetical protein
MNTGNTIVTTDITFPYGRQLYFGAQNNWRVNIVNTSGVDRLNFEYLDDASGQWVVGVPFIVK